MRRSRTSFSASRRSVFTRSPDFFATSEGAHRAGKSLGRQMPIQAVAAGPGFVDKPHFGRLGLHARTQPVDVTVPHPDLAQGLHLPQAHRIRCNDRMLAYVQPDKDGVIVIYADLRAGKPIHERSFVSLLRPWQNANPRNGPRGGQRFVQRKSYCLGTMKKALTLAAAVLAACSVTNEQAHSCHTKDQLFSQIRVAIGDGKVAGVSKRGGETLGWKLANVPEDAPIRRRGFGDKDWLHKICGLTIDRFAASEGQVCCEHPSGIVLGFLRADDSEYQMAFP